MHMMAAAEQTGNKQAALSKCCTCMGAQVLLQARLHPCGQCHTLMMIASKTDDPAAAYSIALATAVSLQPVGQNHP
jgi:hypothetical protein